MSVEKKTLKDPVKALEGILSGLAKTLAQLDSHAMAADAYIIQRENEIARLLAEKKAAENVAERAEKVSANLKELLALE